MKNKIKKQILDDFNKTYQVNIDREKILNNLEIKEPKENKVITIFKLQKQKKYLVATISLLIVCLITAVIFVNNSIKKIEEKEKLNIAICEFKEYIGEYTSCGKYDTFSEIELKTSEFIFIYKSSYKIDNITKNVYFYFIDYEDNKSCTISFNDQKITAKHLEYGILYEIIEGEEVTLNLTIKYGKKTKNHALTLK